MRREYQTEENAMAGPHDTDVGRLEAEIAELTRQCSLAKCRLKQEEARCDRLLKEIAEQRDINDEVNQHIDTMRQDLADSNHWRARYCNDADYHSRLVLEQYDVIRSLERELSKHRADHEAMELLREWAPCNVCFVKCNALICGYPLFEAKLGYGRWAESNDPALAVLAAAAGKRLGADVELKEGDVADFDTRPKHQRGE